MTVVLKFYLNRYVKSTTTPYHTCIGQNNYSMKSRSKVLGQSAYSKNWPRTNTTQRFTLESIIAEGKHDSTKDHAKVNGASNIGQGHRVKVYV